MALIKCEECGQMVSDKASTCPHCGAPVEKKITCEKCGTEIPESSTSCPNCGTPIDIVREEHSSEKEMTNRISSMSPFGGGNENKSTSSANKGKSVLGGIICFVLVGAFVLWMQPFLKPSHSSNLDETLRTLGLGNTHIGYNSNSTSTSYNSSTRSNTQSISGTYLIKNSIDSENIKQILTLNSDGSVEYTSYMNGNVYKHTLGVWEDRTALGYIFISLNNLVNIILGNNKNSVFHLYIMDNKIAADDNYIKSHDTSKYSELVRYTQVAEDQSSKITGYINGHGYVDLGLSVKWATCNVGANSPEEYGNYYAWGEIAPKSEYTEENCTTWEKDLGDISGNPNYDAARANWGSTWRMPTIKEIEELSCNCITDDTTLNGVDGMEVKSEINGNSIFLPSTDEGARGYYWSSSHIREDLNSDELLQGAATLSFFNGNYNLFTSFNNRYEGLSVRPVTE